jgi:hypothetical protein
MRRPEPINIDQANESLKKLRSLAFIPYLIGQRVELDLAFEGGTKRGWYVVELVTVAKLPGEEFHVDTVFKSVEETAAELRRVTLRAPNFVKPIYGGANA